MSQQLDKAQLAKALKFKAHEKQRSFAWADMLPPNLFHLQTLAFGDDNLKIPVSLLVSNRHHTIILVILTFFF